MKRRSVEDYQRDRRARAEQQTRTTPGDQERKTRILDNGLESLRRLHGDQTWEDWLVVGEAMTVITEDALASFGLAVWDKDNKRLVRAFTSAWEDYERRLGGNYKPLTKQERWALREVMTNSEIGVWRGLLDGPQKRRLNHPNAVINKWKSSTQTKETRGREPSAAMSKALASRDETIAQLQAHVVELEAARETAGTAGEDGTEPTPEALLASIDRVLSLAAHEPAWPPLSSRKTAKRKKLLDEIRLRLIDLHGLATAAGMDA